jgi:hypothetical protein
VVGLEERAWEPNRARNSHPTAAPVVDDDDDDKADDPSGVGLCQGGEVATGLGRGRLNSPTVLEPGHSGDGGERDDRAGEGDIDDGESDGNGGDREGDGIGVDGESEDDVHDSESDGNGFDREGDGNGNDGECGGESYYVDGMMSGEDEGGNHDEFIDDEPSAFDEIGSQRFEAGDNENGADLDDEASDGTGSGGEGGVDFGEECNDGGPERAGSAWVEQRGGASVWRRDDGPTGGGHVGEDVGEAGDETGRFEGDDAGGKTSTATMDAGTAAEDESLMSKLAAALSQRIKDIYDI